MRKVIAILVVGSPLLFSSAALHAKEIDPAQCASLRAELRKVTDAQRARSTTHLQERRKKIKDQMWSLKCSEMGPKG